MRTSALKGPLRQGSWTIWTAECWACRCGTVLCHKVLSVRRYNNDERIANSVAKSAMKLVYYYAFATLYGLAGGWANVSARADLLCADFDCASRQALWQESEPSLAELPCHASSCSH